MTAGGDVNGGWPNLFLVGAPRCGTTSLWRYLDRHPDVFIAPVKEPNFFSGIRSPLNAEVHDEASYLRLFAPGARCELRGEASVSYLRVPGVAEKIKRVSPGARILVSLRDPVDRAYSGWGYMSLLGKEDRSFERAVREELVETRNRIVRSSLYAEDLERYLRTFPGAVHVLFLEELAADPRREMRGVFDFLGVDPTAADALEAERHNAQARPRGRMAEMAHNSPRFRSAMRALVPLWVRLRARDLLVKRSTQEPMVEETEAELTELFAPDVERLRGLLGRDVPWPRFAGDHVRTSPYSPR